MSGRNTGSRTWGQKPDRGLPKSRMSRLELRPLQVQIGYLQEQVGDANAAAKPSLGLWNSRMSVCQGCVGMT
jgi:hypothetical protein